MSHYEIKFYVWPYSGVKRESEKYNDGNQSITNPVVKVSAGDFAEAYNIAKHMLTAIRFDGRVWECGIESIAKTK